MTILAWAVPLTVAWLALSCAIGVLVGRTARMRDMRG